MDITLTTYTPSHCPLHQNPFLYTLISLISRHHRTHLSISPVPSTLGGDVHSASHVHPTRTFGDLDAPGRLTRACVQRPAYPLTRTPPTWDTVNLIDFGFVPSLANEIVFLPRIHSQ
jgi:hypothetical protein